MGSHQRYHHSRRRQGTERIQEICEAFQEGQQWHHSLKEGWKNFNKSTTDG